MSIKEGWFRNSFSSGVEELFSMLMITVIICKLDDLQGEAAPSKERRKKGKEVEEGSEREERKEEG